MEYRVKQIKHYVDDWSARVVVVMNEDGEAEVAAIVNCRSGLKEQLNIEQVKQELNKSVSEKEERFWESLIEEMS